MSISSAMMAATPEASPMRQRVARGPTSAAYSAQQDATQQDAALLLLSLSHPGKTLPQMRDIVAARENEAFSPEDDWKEKK
jgi:hypothetical protein